MARVRRGEGGRQGDKGDKETRGQGRQGDKGDKETRGQGRQGDKETRENLPPQLPHLPLPLSPSPPLPIPSSPSSPSSPLSHPPTSRSPLSILGNKLDSERDIGITATQSCDSLDSNSWRALL
ncbi:MAG: hypothetical protein KME31_32775 [Tolypothrix carrinoi HA7290-LM1]|nr:hypothetical protein [Tolypothrix carrinoi HA7290-LM1]